MNARLDDLRAAELVASLAGVRARLADAAIAVDRDPWSVTLVAVTKTFPATDMAILLGLGIVDIAESRDQEARAKLAELAKFAAPSDTQLVEPRLHFVGRLQTNKCRSVARYAHFVHTVDRIEVAAALAEGVRAADREPLCVFVQVSLDGDPHRGGVAIGDVDALADSVTGTSELRLMGVMAVAPLAARPSVAFTALAEVSAAVRVNHPEAASISAGMSGDFEEAVKSGATHVRIGSALLGRREATFG